MQADKSGRCFHCTHHNVCLLWGSQNLDRAFCSSRQTQDLCVIFEVDGSNHRFDGDRPAWQLCGPTMYRTQELVACLQDLGCSVQAGHSPTASHAGRCFADDLIAILRQTHTSDHQSNWNAANATLRAHHPPQREWLISGFGLKPVRVPSQNQALGNILQSVRFRLRGSRCPASTPAAARRPI